MSDFNYHGPVQALTLGDQDVILNPGHACSLPSDNDLVKSMLASGLLTPIARAAKTPVKKEESSNAA